MPIISASRRTDLPAHYTDWLLARLAAGYCLVRNPFNQRQTRVSLAPADVDGIVFWTRNPQPLLPHLPGLRARGYHGYFQLTLTPYRAPLEPGAPDPQQAVDRVRALADVLGPDLVVWRFDPLVETTAQPWDWHLERFDALAQALDGATRRCVFSFVNLYRRSRLRLDALAAEHGWRYRYYATAPREAALARGGDAFTREEMASRAAELAALASARGLRLQSCCGPDWPGIERARCIDPELLALARGAPVTAPAHPSRPGCGCAASIDIGAYETCPRGCGASYCYAVQSRARALAYRRRHDPTAEAL
jgi:hypothetical protein